MNGRRVSEPRNRTNGPPSASLLIMGIFRVASTLAGITILGVAFDRLLVLPLWPGGVWTVAGVALAILGLAIEGAATRAFWKYGRGTPNPDGHPIHLVVEGPYAWSRHPLYLARLFLLVGVGFLIESISTLALTLLLFVVVNWILIPREESRLSVRFGERYVEYRKRVSKWITLSSRVRTRSR